MTVEKVNERTHSCDEAVELTGDGRYSWYVVTACSVIANAGALDMFGFSVVIAAATCDLKLDLTTTGALASAPFAGLLFAYPWGYFADVRGRRFAILVSTTMGFTFAALSSLAPSWQIMLTLKVFATSFSSAAITLTTVYVGENTVQEHRNRYLFVVNSFNLASEVVCYILAYFILGFDFNIPIPWLSITYRPWRLLVLAIAAPLGFGALMMFFLYESPKFLANIGQYDRALDVLKDIYKKNGGNKEEYPVEILNSVGCEEKSDESGSFWDSMMRRTAPVFRPPLLWRTLQLFYLLIICCATNNVFFMWFPKMVNSFFGSFDGSLLSTDQSFCQRAISNMSDTAVDPPSCNDTLSPNTLYSGMSYGLFFMLLNLLVSRVAAHRRLILLVVLGVSAASSVLVEAIHQPIFNMIAFTLLQGTCIGIGIVTSYFVDLYPTSSRGIVTSVGMMMARAFSLAGVNIIGAVIVHHCALTFYCCSVFVTSGVFVGFFLPPDIRKRSTNRE